MTDPKSPPPPPTERLPRVDLRALDAGADPEQADRVVRAVIARLPGRPRAAASVWDDVAAWLRPGLVAAASVAAIALAAAAAVARRESPERTAAATAPATPEARVAEWAESGRVPSARELLATFQGYAP
jgi:hypothetical protein